MDDAWSVAGATRQVRRLTRRPVARGAVPFARRAVPVMCRAVPVARGAVPIVCRAVSRSLVVLACALIPWVAHALTLAELLGSMSAITDQRGRFVERKTLAVLDKPVEVKGTLVYRRPDFLERRNDPPADEVMTVSGDHLNVAWPSKHEKRDLTLSSNPVVWAFVESIRATLSGNGASLERFYWATLTGTLDHWTLSLEPRASGVASYVKTILLSGDHTRIRRVQVMEANGDESVMDIQPLPDRG